jgi:hypothetical protein
MTDFEIMELLDRQCSNWEKGAILRKAFDALKPSALNIKPKQERKKRAQKAPAIQGGIPGNLLNGAGHEVGQ